MGIKIPELNINIEEDELYNLDVQSIDHPTISSGGKWILNNVWVVHNGNCWFLSVYL
nr:1861_t:CDS:2 [Entrophospora candida]CAG8550276.1 9841_t:CDS:2 [Entrophospora candida]